MPGSLRTCAISLCQPCGVEDGDRARLTGARNREHNRRCRFRSCGGAEPDVQSRGNRLPALATARRMRLLLHRLLNSERLPRLAIHALSQETFSPRV
jgi:hypothetical protein